MNSAKVYVNVLASFDPGGKMRPLVLIWEDGTKYRIDRVTDVRCAAAQKAGGCGDRYTIRIGGRQSYLFFEHFSADRPGETGRWFVERKEPDEQSGEG